MLAKYGLEQSPGEDRKGEGEKEIRRPSERGGTEPFSFLQGVMTLCPEKLNFMKQKFTTSSGALPPLKSLSPII